MNSYWQEFSLITKFSVIAFFVAGTVGYCSVGMLGLFLYYPISFITKPFFGNLNTWTGDNLWPTAMWVGILWSLGFLMASTALHFLYKYNLNVLILCLIYVGILWTWALCLWLIFLSRKM